MAIHNNGEPRKILKPTSPADLDLNERQNQEMVWKYGEGAVLADLRNHIVETYTSHYAGEQDDVQTIDVFAYRGTLATTSIDNAIKYLMRYGKKDGKNENDLIKAMHYLVLATAYERKLKKKADLNNGLLKEQSMDRYGNLDYNVTYSGEDGIPIDFSSDQYEPTVPPMSDDITVGSNEEIKQEPTL